MKAHYFIKIQNLFIAKGYNRCVIIDVQRHQLYYLPNEIKDILDYKYGNTLEQVKGKLKAEKDVVEEYFEFLLAKEIIYFVPKSLTNCFPPIKIEFKKSSICELVVINFANTLPESSFFDKLGTHHLEIRLSIQHLKSLVKEIDKLDYSLINSIDVYILNKSKKEITKEYQEYLNLLAQNRRIFSISIEVGRSSIKAKKSSKINRVKKIDFDKNNVYGESSMTVNMKFYMESYFFNPFYNNKLFIDTDFKIYNTQKKRICFGTYEEIVQLKAVELEKLWKHELNQPNSKIEECSFCEYSFTCLNSLRRKENASENLFNEEECNYNPFISKWKGEEGYKTLKQCGVISNEQGFSINHKKLEKINKALWSED